MGHMHRTIKIEVKINNFQNIEEVCKRIQELEENNLYVEAHIEVDLRD